MEFNVKNAHFIKINFMKNILKEKNFKMKFRN